MILLNDATYVEAARALAVLVLTADSEVPTRVQQMFRRVLSRHPDDAEIRLLSDFLQRQRDRFGDHPEEATLLLAVGESEVDETLDVGELAAWTVLAHTLLNLDEAVTRR